MDENDNAWMCYMILWIVCTSFLKIVRSTSGCLEDVVWFVHDTVSFY